jgi:uncharacterized protein (TIGR03790 family)
VGCAVLLGGPAVTQPDAPATLEASPVAAQPAWVPVPRVGGRLHAADIGLVINSADPYSVAVGEYYKRRRGLTERQVLRIDLPLKATLTQDEFAVLQQAIQARFGTRTQALALAWKQPYAVNCNSITGALALGFDAGLCQNSCAPSAVSPYANSAATQPWRQLGMRLSMLLAARDVEAAQRMIDRGVASDGSLGLRGAPPARAYFLATGDSRRNVRARLYPPANELRRLGIEVHVVAAPAFTDRRDLLVVQTGSAQVDFLPSLHWLAGGLGDNLTSYGGQLAVASGHSTALDWIESGATASYGTVSEPCNHLQKFPHPQWLLLHYLQGSTAIEAYWKSVLWPQQGLFVGEPLAAPFARR